MTLQFYAQPYDITATGFYFGSTEEYAEKSASLRNDYGDPVEEFEIQFIDRELIGMATTKPVLLLRLVSVVTPLIRQLIPVA